MALVPGQLPAGTRAWLVGSLAWGGFGERSEVDLVLDGVSGPLATAIEIADQGHRGRSRSASVSRALAFVPELGTAGKTRHPDPEVVVRLTRARSRT